MIFFGLDFFVLICRKMEKKRLTHVLFLRFATVEVCTWLNVWLLRFAPEIR